MSIFTAWLIIASVNLAATMSPGPAFAITVRNALAYDRRSGIFTAMGLGAGVAVHVFLVLTGFALILSKSLLLFTIMKYAGAAYLIYIGSKALMTKKKEQDFETIAAQNKNLPDLKAFQIGFLANVLNPKAVVFFTAVYAQFVAPHTPWEILVLYGATSILIEALWFSAVTLFLTEPRIKAQFVKASHWIERICGGLLIALGIRLAVDKAL